jgi:hypothetical protein
MMRISILIAGFLFVQIASVFARLSIDHEVLSLLAPSRAVFDRNIPIEKHAEFITVLHDTIEDTIPHVSRGFDLIITVRFSAASPPKYKIVTRPQPPDKILGAIRHALAATPQLRSKRDDVWFRISWYVPVSPNHAMETGYDWRQVF